MEPPARGGGRGTSGRALQFPPPLRQEKMEQSEAALML